MLSRPLPEPGREPSCITVSDLIWVTSPQLHVSQTSTPHAPPSTVNWLFCLQRGLSLSPLSLLKLSCGIMYEWQLCSGRLKLPLTPQPELDSYADEPIASRTSLKALLSSSAFPLPRFPALISSTLPPPPPTHSLPSQHKSWRGEITKWQVQQLPWISSAVSLVKKIRSILEKKKAKLRAQKSVRLAHILIQFFLPI